jgi:hypothetical protein
MLQEPSLCRKILTSRKEVFVMPSEHVDSYSDRRQEQVSLEQRKRMSKELTVSSIPPAWEPIMRERCSHIVPIR